jgi:hypothetical protein
VIELRRDRGVVLEKDFDVHEFRHFYRNKKTVSEGESIEERQGQASRKGLPGPRSPSMSFQVRVL